MFHLETLRLTNSVLGIGPFVTKKKPVKSCSFCVSKTNLDDIKSSSANFLKSIVYFVPSAKLIPVIYFLILQTGTPSESHSPALEALLRRAAAALFWGDIGTWMPSVPGCCSNLTVRVCAVFCPRPSCQVRLLPPARRGSW